MAEIPDRLNADVRDRDLYDRLQTEGMFKSTDRKDQFLFAMAFGCKSEARLPLDKKDGLVRTSYLRAEDEALMNAVAVHHAGSLEVLADREQVYKIAEEYAHAGIRLLVDWIESQPYGSVETRFEKELRDVFDALVGGDHEKSALG